MTHSASTQKSLPERAINYAKFRFRQQKEKIERPMLIKKAFAEAKRIGAAPKAEGKRALLLPTASPGNLGDDAVFRASVRELLAMGFSRVSVISFGEDQKYDIEGAETVVIQLHHTPMGRDYLNFVQYAKDFTHFYIWGADIVDGTHGLGVVEPREVMANLAVEMGLKANFCSFSVAENRTQPAMDYFRSLDPRVKIQCRDRISAERLQSELPDHEVEITADLAFMLKPDHEAETSRNAKEWVEARRAEGRIVMGLNMNDLFCSYFGIPRPDLLRYYTEALTGLYEQVPNLAIIHIPHDTHANKKLGKMTDFTLAKELNATLPEGLARDAFMPGEGLTAPEVRAICSYVDLVFSARMHLSIASLAVGTPVFALRYQGKFEGLFDHFGLEDMSISHEELPDIPSTIAFLKRSVDRREAVRAQVAEKLPRVLSLSRNNLDI